MYSTLQYYLTYSNLIVNGIIPLLLLLFLNLKVYKRWTIFGLNIIFLIILGKGEKKNPKKK